MKLSVHNTKQPLYSKSIAKYMARELHIILYPLLTGNYSVPEDKHYWFLCNLQDKTKGSEVVQITQNRSKGPFVKPNQCYGVDYNKTIIRRNKKYHPEVNWFQSEWTRAIKDNYFNPALVYLDTTYFADRYPALRALKTTLDLCKKNTLVICNVMMSNSRAGTGSNLFDESAIIENLLYGDHPQAYSDWNRSKSNPEVNIFHSYEYQTSCTPMRSYIFFKGDLPEESLIQKEFDKFKNWCTYNQFQL